MAYIPAYFMSAVVALGVDAPNNNKHWIGTGFIVGRKEQNNPNLSTHYLITNKHVVRNQEYVYVRFNSLGESLVKDYRVNLFDLNKQPAFTYHPNETTDVIAMQIIPQTLINDKSIWGSFDLEENALTLKKMQDEHIEEGSLVCALGFPMNLVGAIKTPICRLGCISRVADAFLLSKGTPQFLVDAQTFPGNSGGPIVFRPEGTASQSESKLIGVLSGYIPYEDTLISQQTQKPVMIQRENSGLTIVHPVDRIKEVVELEWQRIEKNKQVKTTVK